MKITPKELYTETKIFVKELVQDLSFSPKLAVIVVGNNAASAVYVRNKKRDCEECNILFEEYSYSEEVAEAELMKKIEELNADESVNGILVQLPLPPHINEDKVLQSIEPTKDVDGFHVVNAGKLALGLSCTYPCTPLGIIRFLAANDIELSGKNCVIIGRSNIVGKPMAQLLLQQDATITICHSKTKNLIEHTKAADIIICAVGRPNFLGADMIKDGAVVIDVGINKTSNGKLCGDVKYDEVKEKASLVTPVPGGAGLLTRSSLLLNIATVAVKGDFKKNIAKINSI